MMNGRKIVPVSVSGLDCFTNTVLTLVNFQYGEYQKALWDSWLFNYKENEKAISKRIKIPSNVYIENACKFYGVNVVERYVDKSSFVKEICNLISENGPVMVCIDTFFCEWYDNYHKKHSSHIFLVERYEKGFFHICDTMPIRVDIQLSSENLLRGFKWLKYISFQKKVCIEPIKLSSFLHYTVDRKIRNREIKALSDFVKNLSYEILHEEIDKTGYVWSIPILNCIRRVYGSRNHFMEVIDYIYISSKDIRCLDIKEVYKEIVCIWGKVTNTLYRFYFKKHDRELYEKVIRYLVEALNKEESMIDYLTRNENKRFERRKMCSHQIDLNFNFFSHFFEEKDFIRNTKIQNGKIWECESIDFSFPAVESNNCMVCDKQKLVVKGKNVKQIHFIGYSVWGDQVDDIFFLMEDGTIQKREISISDWCTGPSFAESIIWEGEFVEKKSNLIYKGYIYDFILEFEFDENIDLIIMPSNKNIILFALVTLALGGN